MSLSGSPERPRTSQSPVAVSRLSLEAAESTEPAVTSARRLRSRHHPLRREGFACADAAVAGILEATTSWDSGLPAANKSIHAELRPRLRERPDCLECAPGAF